MAPSAHDHRPDIQGLRALAVVLVVLFHADLPVPGGYIGVDTFFVISGFVITAGLLRATNTGGFSLVAFYARRARRLMPALAVVLTVTALLHIGFGPENTLGTTAATAAAAASLNANHYLLSTGGYFDAALERNALLHTWSLSVEEQFYLVFPFLMVLGFRRPSGPMRAVLALTVASWCIGVAFWWQQSFAGVDLVRLGFFSSITRAWEFGVGALLAFGAGRVAAWPKAWRGLLGVVGLASTVAAALTFDGQTVFPGVAALVPVLGALGLLIAGVGEPIWTATWFRHRVLTWIGDRSYAWYLWHWPLIVFAKASWPSQPWVVPVAAIASLGLAAATERWVERPIRYRPVDQQRPAWVLALICVGAPLAAWPLVGLSRHVSDDTPVLHALRATVAASDAVPCKDGLRPSKVGPECRWGDGRSAVLVGDSNAHQFVPYFKTTFPDGLASTMLGCPFVDAPHFRDGRRHKRCEKFVEDTLGDLAALKPHAVYIGMASDTYIHEPRFVFGHPKGSTAPADKEAFLQTRLTGIVHTLREAGVAQVVLIQPIPKFVDAGGHPMTMGADCSWWGLVHDPMCTPESSVAKHAPLDLYRRIAQADTVDFAPQICPDGTCRAWQDGVWRYRDATHLSHAMGAIVPMPATPLENGSN